MGPGEAGRLWGVAGGGVGVGVGRQGEAGAGSGTSLLILYAGAQKAYKFFYKFIVHNATVWIEQR